MLKKKECNLKAQKIVLELIDGVENESQFLELLQSINENHYQDVVEERAIVKLCGYPICEQNLGTIPKKKYHISVSQNKVYDITERKLFCSNQCYKASSFLKMQLYTSPLWLRDHEKRKTFTLLQSKTELIGEEISFGIEKVKLPEDSHSLDEKVSTVDINDEEQICTYKLQDDYEFYAQNESCSRDESPAISDSEKSDNDEKEEDKQPTKELKNFASETLSSSPISDQHAECERVNSTDKSIIRIKVKKDELKAKNHSLGGTDSNTFERTESRQLPKRKPKLDGDKEITAKESEDFVSHVEKSLKEWITVDTLCSIKGEQAVIDLMREKDISRDASNIIKNNPLFHERYNALCKKLDVLELEEEKTSGEFLAYEPPSKPLPDFESLKQQTKDLEIKVKAFYRGDRKVTFDETNQEDQKESHVNVLPPLHQHAQKTIRRDLVLNKLKFVLPNLCEVFALNSIEVSSEVKNLVHTFHFSAHNIAFKPLEWNLIGLILLKLLSINNHSIRARLQEKNYFIHTVMNSYCLENNYLDCFIDSLFDIELILKKQTTS